MAMSQPTPNISQIWAQLRQVLSRSRRSARRTRAKFYAGADDCIISLCRASLESVSSATSATTPLLIDIDKVIEVLLPDGAWHKVKPGSFTIAPYSFVTYRTPRARRRREPDEIHNPTVVGQLGLGYMFRLLEDNSVVVGRLEQMMPVRVEES